MPRWAPAANGRLPFATDVYHPGKCWGTLSLSLQVPTVYGPRGSSILFLISRYLGGGFGYGIIRSYLCAFPKLSVDPNKS